MSKKSENYNMNDLLQIMEKLRDKANGCEWDKKQTFKSLIKYTIEEAFEVSEAIAKSDYDNLKEECGDLLYQIIFFSSIAKERNLFDFNDVVNDISHKMISRHPHIFSDDNKTIDYSWEDIKKKELHNKHINNSNTTSIFDNIPNDIPSLNKSEIIQRRAAENSFDWKDLSSVFDKIFEEINELKEEIIVKNNQNNIENELGDLLFSIINLGRKLNIDPDIALQKTNSKFEQRFRFIENELLKFNKTISETSLNELEQIWQDSKKFYK